MSILPFRKKNQPNPSTTSSPQSDVVEMVQKLRECYVPYDPSKDPMMKEFRRGLEEIRRGKR